MENIVVVPPDCKGAAQISRVHFASLLTADPEVSDFCSDYQVDEL